MEILKSTEYTRTVQKFQEVLHIIGIPEEEKDEYKNT